MVDVSYIVPVLLNRITDLNISLPTIYKSGVHSFEIIVVVNGVNGSQPDVEKWKNDRTFFVFLDDASSTNSRNVGIRMSKGKWICFLDSDDSLLKNGIGKLLDAGQDGAVDFVVGDYQKIQNGKIVSTKTLGDNFKCWTGKETKQFLRPVLLPSYEMGSLWGKIFLRSFVIDNNLFLKEELSNGEDYDYLVRTVNCAKCIVYVPVEVYGYNLNPSSMTKAYDSLFLEANRRMLFEVKKELTLECDYQVSSNILLFHAFSLKVLTSILVNNVFHPDAGFSLLDCKSRYNDLLSLDPFKESLEDIDAVRLLDPIRKIVVSIAAKGFFLPNFLIARIRHSQRKTLAFIHDAFLKKIQRSKGMS